MSDPTELTLLQAAAALRSGEVSSRELTRACLDRISSLDPKLHAFLALTPELAEAQAAEADRRLAEARRHSSSAWPLTLGIPIAVKDVLCVRDVPTTAGSRILEGFRPPYNATAVQRLVEAGAVILGKTNTDEFAMGSSTENSGFGVTHNPWNLARVPGGSSGGSAAAVAARLSFAGLGSDTGGSIRQPAAFCGVTGLKPSYGRVSRYGLIAYGSSLDSVGCLARSAADLVPVYQAMAGHDPHDSTSAQEPVAPAELNGDVRRLRIGVPEEYFIEGIQPAVEQAVLAAVDVFSQLGATVTRIHLPHTDLALPVYYLIAPAEASANLARYDGVRFGPRRGGQDLAAQYLTTRGELFGSEVKRRIMLGTYALSAGYYDAYYGQAQKVRTLIRDDFDRAFTEVDVIACPVAPTTAFGIGQHGDDPLSMYLEDVFTLPANLAGIPAVAFPVGFDQDGLPVGMQLHGPRWTEHALLRAADAYQRATDWHVRRPELSAA
ncbi:MAG TPA: Asp-tRNA(Asn)/Glu-tRNA(Gln) amidotransferase subunit GatA [Anaerolineales bacterium]|nr:Asp-tRNA(Asn)/Glu-tRNA(Gln) amidotransferase subunit GatA [Anaerolineales bacterium]